MISWNPAELKEHLDKGEGVFLKLWKPGCGACKLSKPAIERLEGEYSSKLSFAQIDTNAHPELLELSDSEVLPVFFIFLNKEQKGKHIGFKGLKKLQTWLEDSLA